MTISRASALAVMAALGVLLTMVGDARQADPGVLLRAAIEKEEVAGDLKGAMALYQQIITAHGKDRAVTAKAMLRLAGCHEKLGQTEARKLYERLVAEYSDQTQEVTSARARLAALTAGAPVRARDSRLTIRRVPNLEGNFAYPSPSPDGKFLAFVDWTSGNLTILDVATGATKALTKDGSWGTTGGFAQVSVWSRDSSRIAYQWVAIGPKGRPELRIVSLSGEKPPEPIAIPGATWIMPHDWSPDGSRILFSYGQGQVSSGLALVGAGSGAVDRLNMRGGSWLYQFAGDGDAILYSAPSDGKAGRGDIFLRNLKTGVATPIVQHPAEEMLVGVLPGTEWLLFASDRQGRLDLWAVPFRQGKADGQPVLVKQGLGRFFPLRFTNDGRFYCATLSATDDVFLADFDPGTGKVTSEARKFPSRWDGATSGPSFSPDGESLAYCVSRDPNPITSLHTADTLVVQSLKAPTAEPVVIGFEEFGLGEVGPPCWLPDGKALVLRGFRKGEQEDALYRVDLPGLRATKIYADADGRRLNDYECATDGPFMYVVTADAGQAAGRRGPRIDRIEVAGGRRRELFQAPQGQGISGIALSPDGRTLSIIITPDRSRRALLVMPSEGGTPRQIHEVRPVTGMIDHRWAPDGRSILYVQGPQGQDRTSFLRSVRADGGGALPEPIFRCTVVFGQLRFHPNGRLLAFTGRPNEGTSSEVWVIENLRDELKRLAPAVKRP
jgi:Tol biopolymer transport system component